MTQVVANWAGLEQCRPSRIERPQGTDELVAAVKAAERDGLPVRAIGAGHSFTGAAMTDGVLLRLDRHAGLVSADRASGRVTVEAGMLLEQLNPLLDQLGLALSNLGDIDRQSVAGAISTGTHGTGARLGGLASQVVGLELVLADGTVVACSADTEPELFAFARVSLGALGLVSTVTLQCEPAFALHAQERPMPLAEVLDRLDELVEDNEHVEFYWWPHTGTTLTKRNNRLAAGEVPEPLSPRRAWLEDELMTNTVFGQLCRLGRRVPAVVPQVNRLAARLMGDRDFSDASHRVFCSPRRVRFAEMEYAVPRAEVAEALRGVQRVVELGPAPVSFPVEVRFTAADDIPLSTAYGRDTAYLAVHMFQGVPYEWYFRGVEAVLAGLGGRPHWGKLHFLDAAGLRPRYPRFDEFVALRDRLDPAGRFANDYLDRVLGR
ncbi:MAG TPA: D-arabinono-1,4-lactone oxidase [Mycobacteriales bacterium]|nr:D-arabinono-1,4-lactone oxidase [Mycobacteriales bacterium]